MTDRISRGRFIIVAGCCLFMMAAALAVSSLMKKIYESSAEIEIRLQSKSEAGGDNYWKFLDNEVMVLSGKIHNIALVGEAASAAGIDAKSGETAEFLKDNISVTRVRDTGIVKITARYFEAGKAAAFVTELIKRYTGAEKSNREERIREKNRSLNELLEKTEADRARHARELAAFNSAHGAVSDSGIIEQKLADLKIKMASLAVRYNDRHPEVINVREQIGKTAKELALSSEKARLTAAAESEDRKIESLKKDIEETIRSSEEVTINVVSPARVSSKPVIPDTGMYLLAGGAAGILIGLIFIFICCTALSAKDIKRLESGTGVPVIGMIPHIGRARLMKSNIRFPDDARRFIVYRSSMSEVTEAYYILWANMKLALQEKKSRILLFTSAGAREGNTLTVINLAIASAMAGIKTLVIDAARSPYMHRMFGLPASPGFSDIISKGARWQDCARDASGFFHSGHLLKVQNLENLRIIPGGAPAGGGRGMMETGKTAPFLEEIRREFELVLFDMPSMALRLGMRELAPMADGIVIVHRFGRPEETLKMFREQLEKTAPAVLGVVLNDVRLRDDRAYYVYSPAGSARPVREGGERKEPGPQPQEASAARQGKKALIVDDEYNVANVITKILLKRSKYEYDVALASNGFDAIQHVNNFNPDVVILDLNLPGVDGFQICRKIKSDEARRGTKVLAMSSMTDPGTRQKIMDCGADRFISKPINLKDFIDAADNIYG